MWAARPVLVRCAAVGTVAVCTVLAINVMPSPKGWPYAVQAADRIAAAIGDAPTAVTGVNKSGGAIELPLRRSGVHIVGPSEAQFLVMTCDPFFERSIGLPCGEPAEKAEAVLVGFLVEQQSCFYNSPRRHVCILTRT